MIGNSNIDSSCNLYNNSSQNITYLFKDCKLEKVRREFLTDCGYILISETQNKIGFGISTMQQTKLHIRNIGRPRFQRRFGQSGLTEMKPYLITRKPPKNS